ncbi:MAG: hypothetical protein Q4G49_12365, partial [Paracoccus sp. (in: a-proteobacteria)]|nr:hypothetical protein [Paracoccus sp. (in: a-proteobacteria)]
PTMLTAQEQKLYYWLTRNRIGGPGAVVDLGSFIGGSTARLAAGMADAGGNDLLHAYDRFTVDPDTQRKFLSDPGIPPIPDGDMFSAAQELLAPWADRIRFHRGEIHELGYDPASGPIAVLILDACKRANWTDVMAADFYPHLVAGRSVVNHQDFLQWNQIWLPPHTALMADFLEPLIFVPGTSLMFRCVRVPTRDDIAARRVEDMDDAQLIEALRDMKRRLRGWGVGTGLDKMIRAIRLNPGERRFWKMRDPDQA